MDLINNQLITACISNKLENVEFLIGKGANVDAKDNRGYTPLMHACAKGYLDIARLSIEKKADITEEDFEKIEFENNEIEELIHNYMITRKCAMYENANTEISERSENLHHHRFLNNLA